MRNGRVRDGSAGAGACVEEGGAAAAAAVAGGHGPGVWDGKTSFPELPSLGWVAS